MTLGCLVPSWWTTNEKGGRSRPIPKTHRLKNLNVLCLQALLALGHLELDRLAFLQRAEAIGLDGGVMYENIFTVLP